MPSTKHSFQRILPASLRWSSSARHRCNRIPLAAHPARPVGDGAFRAVPPGSCAPGISRPEHPQAPFKSLSVIQTGTPATWVRLPGR